MTNAIIINCDIHGIAASRQLDALKHIIDLKELPKELRAVVKDAIIPNEELRPIGKFRMRVASELGPVSIAKHYGYKTTPEKAPEALVALRRIEKEFGSYRADLLNRWDEICLTAQADVYQRFSGYSIQDKMVEAVRRAQPSKSDVAAKIGMSIKVTAVADAQDVSDDADLQKALLDSEVEDAKSDFETLMEDTAKTADNILSLLLKGENDKAVNRRTLSKARKHLVEKVNDLAFGSHKAKALAGGVKRVLQPLLDIDAGNTVRIADCGELIATLTIVSNVERLNNHLDSLKEGEVFIPASVATLGSVGSDSDSDSESHGLSWLEDDEDEFSAFAPAVSKRETSDAEEEAGLEPAEPEAEVDLFVGGGMFV